MTTADQIREFLKERIPAQFPNLNQFAKVADVRQASLYDIIYSPSKTPNPTTETLEKISKTLGYGEVWEFLRDANNAYIQKNDATEREKIERVGSSVIEMMPEIEESISVQNGESICFSR